MENPVDLDLGGIVPMLLEQIPGGIVGLVHLAGGEDVAVGISLQILLQGIVPLVHGKHEGRQIRPGLDRIEGSLQLGKVKT